MCTETCAWAHKRACQTKKTHIPSNVLTQTNRRSNKHENARKRMHKKPQNANTYMNANTRSTIIQQCIYKHAVSYSQRSRRVHLCTKKQAHSPPSQICRCARTQDHGCTCSNIPARAHGHAHILTKRTHSHAHNMRTSAHMRKQAYAPKHVGSCTNVHLHNWASTFTHARKHKYAWEHKHAHAGEPTCTHTNMHIHVCMHWLMCASTNPHEWACSPLQMCMRTHRTCVCMEKLANSLAKNMCKGTTMLAQYTWTCTSMSITSLSSKRAHRSYRQARICTLIPRANVHKHTPLHNDAHMLAQKHTHTNTCTVPPANLRTHPRTNLQTCTNAHPT
jgi:hypothetical protein